MKRAALPIMVASICRSELHHIYLASFQRLLKQNLEENAQHPDSLHIGFPQGEASVVTLAAFKFMRFCSSSVYKMRLSVS